ncbi:RNA polymerase sigma-70 factor [Ornithinibacillus sp. L9]|uniref:RNA polymerase sigma-70 factor n=1 Tax=Ornithinibacillus caprae TaxID=2678566 RepID=A0A6N8FPY4_9BACI|nr:RNA polymerase sigma-70 factor [Ornithinibacillus caprae]MUK90784.1 RNA polymerase sigma-70 factor [Ornithinibacillus caprae]
MQISNEEYQLYKPLLFSLGYRLLGSISEAEDLVHDTFLRAYEVDEQYVKNKKAYLCKMMTNRCLDVLKSARMKKESYIGPWNPEPLLLDNLDDNPIDGVLQKEGLSIAYLRMMENLSPIERAVVLLRDIFEMPYVEISDTVNKKVDHCRKLYSRSKEKLRKVEDESLHYEHNKHVIDQFITSLQTQNKEKLLQLLSENITLYSDGGGKVLAALRPIESRKNVVAFLQGLLKKAAGDYDHEVVNVNGQPAILIFMNGALNSVMSFYIKNDTVHELYITLNPDKLTTRNLK